MTLQTTKSDLWRLARPHSRSIQKLISKYDQLSDQRWLLRARLHRIDRAIEMRKKDETRVGTSCFSTLSAAQSYYSDYGFDVNAVSRKVADGEITIGSPPLGLDKRVWLDEDGRWFVPLRSADSLMELYKRDSEPWDHLCSQIRTLATAINDSLRVRRLEATHCVSSSSWREFQTQLKAIITRQWEIRLPYCIYGRPFYSAEDLNNAEKQPGNTDIIVSDRWPGLAFLRLRQVWIAEGDHWGMRDRPPVFAVATPDGVQRVLSHSAPAAIEHMRDIVKEIDSGQWPLPSLL